MSADREAIRQALLALPVEVPDPAFVCDPAPFVIVPVDLLNAAADALACAPEPPTTNPKEE